MNDIPRIGKDRWTEISSTKYDSNCYESHSSRWDKSVHLLRTKEGFIIHSTQSTQHNTTLRPKVTTKNEIEKQNTEHNLTLRSQIPVIVWYVASICSFYVLLVSKSSSFLNAVIQSRCEVRLPSLDLSETLCGWVTSEPLPFQSDTHCSLCAFIMFTMGRHHCACVVKSCDKQQFMSCEGGLCGIKLKEKVTTWKFSNVIGTVLRVYVVWMVFWISPFWLTSKLNR